VRADTRNGCSTSRHRVFRVFTDCFEIAIETGIAIETNRFEIAIEQLRRDLKKKTLSWV
jgi:hypothetical protein